MIRDDHPAIFAVGGNRAGVFVYTQDDISTVVLTKLVGALPSQFVDDIAGLYIPAMKKENGFCLSKNIKKLSKNLETKGYKHAIEMTEALTRELRLSFSEDEINLWGYSLISQGKTKQALDVFKLNVYLFQLSYNTYASLSEGDWHLGNYPKAIKGDQKVLELQPNNSNAKDKIKKLILLIQ
ncbi:hypothetical protein HQQ94_16545 [Shewanella sp. VB17]|uniref:hypothetical protein n=1 Tax=Shewanella sp. VB17 TaxID=2739432 RepID=UPI001565B56A|nr:hypothetical protein [Shewanella sp. VB17]NRD74797.1 hypothetical protein [Shewanella sp. VB17]